jgi:[ribosomal protein S5]-alanine N-acetyltransferase
MKVTPSTSAVNIRCGPAGSAAYYAFALPAPKGPAKACATADGDQIGVVAVDAVGDQAHEVLGRPVTHPRLSSVIETERLRLDALDAAAAQAIAAGSREGQSWHVEFPRGDDQDGAGMVLQHGETPFGCHVIIEKVSGLAVGTIGFFGPPDDTGTVMIGFGVVNAVRGQGYATEALRGLVEYACAQPSVRTITADSLQHNVAAHRVLEKAGFSRRGATGDAYWYVIQIVDEGGSRIHGLPWQGASTC